jgi:hypothetical protein
MLSFLAIRRRAKNFKKKFDPVARTENRLCAPLV